MKVTPEERTPYVSLESCSSSARASLRAAWMRPVRHNRRIERNALWAVVQTAIVAKRLQQRQDLRLLCAADEPADVYELRAGLQTVPALTPYSDDELKCLFQADRGRDILFEHGLEFDGLAGIADREPILAERWHTWLWHREPGRTRDTPSYESQILQEGCRRLHIGVTALLTATRS